jgi:hypothetical protein
MKGASVDSAVRTKGLVCFCAGLGAWAVCGWLGVQLTDWSFAPFVPAALLPITWLTWTVLGGLVVLQTVRHGRGERSWRKALLLIGVPGALSLQVALIVGPIGPPAHFRLMGEFRRHRSEFDHLAAVAGPELAAFGLVEAGASSSRGSPRVAPRAAQSRPQRLSVVEVRRRGPCLEIIRWSAGSSAAGFEIGFLYSERSPDLIEIPIDRETFLRGGLRDYEQLDAHWYLFRAAW